MGSSILTDCVAIRSCNFHVALRTFASMICNRKSSHRCLRNNIASVCIRLQVEMAGLELFHCRIWMILIVKIYVAQFCLEIQEHKTDEMTMIESDEVLSL